MCIKNIKYMQSHFNESFNLSAFQTPWNKESARRKEKKWAAVVYMFIHYGQKIRSNYIWQPALYFNLIMSFCIQSNKGPAECYNENVYYHPLNESPRCPFLQMSALSRAFQKPAISAQSALGNVQKWSLWASSRLELMSDIVAFKKSFWSLNAAR